jgi:hypothetical protein
VLLPGVTMNNRKNKYKSRIVVSKKCFWLGTFDTAEEAHAAYVKAKDDIAKGILPNGDRQ